MACEKHSFSGSEIGHAWAHQTSTYGRRSDGRMYFEQDSFPAETKSLKRLSTIYSYGSHFPIATLYERKGNCFILFTNRNYSTSTSQHCAYVRGACSHIPTFHVYNPRDPNATKAEYQARIAASLAHIANPKSKRIAPDLASIRATIIKANEFAAAFGFSWRLKHKEPSAEILARSADLEQKHEARERLKETCRKEREERNRAARLDSVRQHIIMWRADPSQIIDKYHLANWRDNPEWTAADSAEAERREVNKIALWREHGGSGYNLPGTFLRLGGKTIYTSQGADCPTEHGIKAWQIIKACRAAHREWHTNGHTIHLGHYKLDSISAEGDVVAGCHRVPYTEIAAIAAQLNLEG